MSRVPYARARSRLDRQQLLRLADVARRAHPAIERERPTDVVLLPRLQAEERFQWPRADAAADLARLVEVPRRGRQGRPQPRRLELLALEHLDDLCLAS